MNKEKNMLDYLKEVRDIAQNNLENKSGYENYVVKNVIHYNKKVELVNKETKEKESFDLCVVIAENPDTNELTEFYYLKGEEQEFAKEVDFEELMKKYESPKPIIDNTKENKEKSEEEQDKELTTDDLNELEEKEKEEETKTESNKENEEEKADNLKISNAKGEVNLDQMVNGETLRKILNLEEEYVSIVPVRAETVGVKSSAEYCFVAKKSDNTCKVLDEDILTEDRQKGVNPYEKDLKVNSDGTLTKESNVTGFSIPNRPNLFISVGLDENSSTRETRITDVSGRESRDKDVSMELEKNGDGFQDSNARDELREENGIDGSDDMQKAQEAHEERECENDRIENIDDDKQNDIHNHIVITADTIVPGKEEMTVEQWAEELGENTKVIIDRLQKEIDNNKDRDPEKIVEEIEEDYRNVNREHKL